MSRYLRLGPIVAAVVLVSSAASAAPGASPVASVASGAAKIAFVASPDLFVVDADGTGLRNLSHEKSPNDAEEPDWSPDGRQIAFVSGYERHVPFDIFVVNADGSGKRNLTRDAVDDNAPDWSPDGKQIVFVRGVQYRGDIVVMNADGTAKRDLTPTLNGKPMAPNGEPDWSPDGKQIAFVCVDGICVINADGTDERRLTSNAGNFLSHPVWSPDGRRIAFLRRFDNTPQIRFAVYVMNGDGSGQRRVTPTRIEADYALPTWSPDGTQIAFTAVTLDKRGSATGRGDIFAANPDGSGLRNLTRRPAEYGSPAWSPDGRQIAFARGFGLFVIDVDGSHLRRVVKDGPSFFPPGVGVAWQRAS